MFEFFELGYMLARAVENRRIVAGSKRAFEAGIAFEHIEHLARSGAVLCGLNRAGDQLFDFGHAILDRGLHHFAHRNRVRHGDRLGAALQIRSGPFKLEQFDHFFRLPVRQQVDHIVLQLRQQLIADPAAQTRLAHAFDGVVDFGELAINRCQRLAGGDAPGRIRDLALELLTQERRFFQADRAPIRSASLDRQIHSIRYGFLLRREFKRRVGIQPGNAQFINRDRKVRSLGRQRVHAFSQVRERSA